MAGRKRSMSDARPGAAKKRRTDSRKISRMRAVSTFAPETKYFDTTFSATVAQTADWASANVAMTSYVTNAGALAAYTDSALIPSANGSGFGEVVGNKYMLKALRVRGEVSVTPLTGQNTATQPPRVRVVLVEDTQPNGAQEAGPNVFLDMGGAPQCNYAFQQMAAGMPGRFKILASEVLALTTPTDVNDGTGTTSAVTLAPALFSFEKQWKRGKKVNIKSNAGGTPAIANLVDENIFMLAHSTAGYTCTITGCARAYYVD